MESNYNIRISDTYMKISKLQNSINNKIFQFITKASELVELSEDMYQIERTIELNKISLKGYLLGSPCCAFLKENNVEDYTIEDLKKYLMKYEQLNNEDCSQYYSAVVLFELLEEIESLVEDKIDLEISKIFELTPLINNIDKINSNEYEKLYNEIKKELTDKYLNQNLIDDKSFETCMGFVNDIFNFFISGYPDIPEEYLYSGKV